MFKVGLRCIVIMLVHFKEQKGIKMLPCEEIMMFEETDIHLGLDLHIMQIF